MPTRRQSRSGAADKSRIIGLDHVQLAMPAGGEDRAREFYTGLLGLPEKPKPPVLAARGGCWFESDRVKLHLGVEAEFRPAQKAHPALLVEDLDALAAEFAAAGVELVPDTDLPGVKRGYVADPFGNRIELIQVENLRSQRRRGRKEALLRRSRLDPQGSL